VIEVFLKRRRGEMPERVESPKTSVVIGRGEDMDWRLNYPDVSRRHCRLFLDGGRLFVEPLAPTNPVLVNRRPIDRPTPLDDGDELVFGECRIRRAVAEPARKTSGLERPMANTGKDRVNDDQPRRSEGAEGAEASEASGGSSDDAPGGGVALDGDWIREDARRWDMLGRPERLLLRGVRLQRAGESLGAARRGRDASLVQSYYDRSVALRRGFLMGGARLAAVVLLSGALGSGLAHGCGGGPVSTEILEQGPSRVCVAEKLKEARTIAEGATTLDDQGRILAEAFAGMVAEESHCREALEIEEGTRDLLRGAGQFEFRAGGGAVSAIAQSPNGRSVGIAGERDVRVFGFSAEVEPVVLDDSGDITALAWSGDSRWLATGARGGRIMLRDAQQEPSYRAAHVMDGHRAEISKISFSPDGNWVATGDAAGEVRMWSMRGSEIGESQGGQQLSGVIRALEFDSKGEKMFVHSGEIVTLWTIERARGRGSLSRRKVLAGDVTAMQVIRDGSSVLTGHLDGQVKIWRPKGRRGALKAQSIRKGNRSAVSGLAFVPGRDEIVVATAKPGLGLVDLNARVREDAFTYSRFTDPLSRPKALAIDATGRRAITIGDQAAEIWDIAERLERPVETVMAPDGGWTAVELPRQRGVVFLGGDDGEVHGRDIFAGSDDGAAYGLGVRDVAAFDLDGAGSTLVSLSREEPSVVRSWLLGEFGQPAVPRRADVGSRLDMVAVSEDGRLVAGCGDDRVIVWEIGREPLSTVELALPGVERLSFAAEGRMLVAAGPDRLRSWKIVGGRPDPSSAADGLVEGRVFALAASKAHVAVGTESAKRGEVLAWQLLDLQHRVVEERMARPVDRIVFDDGGEFLVASSKDNSVKAWRMQATEAVEAPSFTAGSRVTALTLTSVGDETFAALGTSLGEVNVWSLSGDARAGWSAHDGQINGIAFGTSMDTLITADNAGVLRKWMSFDGEWSEDDSLTIATVPGGVLHAASASGGRGVVVLGGDGGVQSWPVDGAALLHRVCLSVGWRELGDGDWNTLGMEPRLLCRSQ